MRVGILGSVLVLAACSSHDERTRPFSTPGAVASVVRVVGGVESPRSGIAPRDGAFRFAVGGDLRGTLGARADQPYRLELPGGATCDVAPVGLRAQAGALEGAVLVFAEAAPDMDVAFVSRGASLEELRVLRDGRSRVLRWRLRPSVGVADVRVREGRVELVDGGGRVALATAPIWARGARGEVRTFAPTLARVGGELELTVDADVQGMTPPVVVDPAWSTAGTPANGHSFLARLPSGDVLALGGDRTAELYDVAANTWTSVGSSNLPYSMQATSIALPSGKVLLVGGAVPLDTLETFDPKTRTFATLVGPGSYVTNRRHLFSATGGRTLLIDSSGPRLFEFVEAKGAWTGPYDAGASINGSAAAQLPGGKILAFGGEVARMAQARAHVFDPATMTWSEGPPLGKRRTDPVAVPLSGGRVLALTTASPVGPAPTHTEVFDPAAGAWSEGPTLPWSPSAYTFFLPLAGGRTFVHELAPPAAAVLDASATTFLAADASPSSAVAVALADGRVLACGLTSAECALFAPSPNGAPCSIATPGNCASLYCVDGVCCDGACDGACVRCDAPASKGTCSAVSGASRAPGACAPYASCVGGTCAASCATSDDCASGAYCESGACRTKKDLGERCSAAAACASGTCVDGVCCDSACSGACEACDIPGRTGTCSAVTGAPRGARAPCEAAPSECGKVCDGKVRATCVYLPAGTSPCGRNACSAGVETHASTCNGAGVCADTPRLCGDYACGADFCKSACGGASDCVPGRVCVAGACVPALGLGAPCSVSAACSTGSCVDGVCCGTPSCPAGSTCGAVGHEGTCTKQRGVACKASGECVTGRCVDGVCCDGACDGQCEACDVPGSVGACAAVVGAPRIGRAACAGTGCEATSCDGKTRATCARKAGPDVSCRDAGCRNGFATLPEGCDGTGACPPARTISCGAYTCDDVGRACRTVCAVSSDCAAEYTCVGGACRPRAPRCTPDYAAKIAADDVETSCGKYLCRAGECPTTCGTSADCAPGALCDNAACVVPTRADDGGGCTAGRRGASATWVAWVVLGMVLAARRRAGLLALVGLSSCTPRAPERAIDPPMRAASMTALDGARHALAIRRAPVLAPLAATDRPLASSSERIGPAADPAFFLDVRATDLRDVSARALRDGAFFADAAEATDVASFREGGRLEELRVLRGPSAPARATYRLTPSPSVAEVRLRGDHLEALDARGRVRLRTDPLLAVEADGTTRPLRSALVAGEGAYVLTLTLDLLDEGARYPITLDPAWSVAAVASAAHMTPRLVALPSGDVLVMSGSYEPRWERFVAATGAFEPVDPPPTYPESTLIHPAVTQLASGKAISIGGSTFFGVSAWVGLYDPSASAWSAAKSLAVARSQASAVRLLDGRILVAGGYTIGEFGATEAVASAEVYDPSADAWTTVGAMSEPRIEPSIVALASGRVLVSGGGRFVGGAWKVASSAELFDPSTNAWSSTGHMLAPRDGHALVRLSSGKVLALGGAPDSTSGAHSSAEQYDPVAGTWTAVGSMSVPRGKPAVGLLPSGRVLVTGGAARVSSAEVFEPSSATFVAAGLARTDRVRPGAAVLPDGRVFVAGGVSYTDASYVFEAEVFAEQALGAPCGSPGECASGYCADGRCCNAACTGACEACAEPSKLGTCTAITGVPRVGHPSCAPALSCAAGACKTGCGLDADCASGAFCDGSGACVVKRPLAAACSGDRECASGHCADGVCCDQRCDGACEACREAGSVGACVLVTGSPRAPRPACGSGSSDACAPRCLGANRKACEFPSAVAPCGVAACTSGVETHVSTCDGVGRCNDVPKTCGAFACGAAACKTTCASGADCAAGFVCKAGACVPAPGLGLPCDATLSCAPGLSCVDGVCCGTASCPAGQSCGLPARKGSCSKPAGVACAADAECGSGNCADGVCCDVACGGQCQACDVPGSVGTCVAIKGAPHAGRLPCAAGATACEATRCDGSDGSRCAALVGSDVACRTARCAEGVATGASSCDGAGRCPATPGVPCAPYACDPEGSACRIACVRREDCAAGHVCKGAVCVKAVAWCSDDGQSVVEADERTTPCAPFRCRDAVCLTECATSGDCLGSAVCSSGRCVVALASEAPASDGCAYGAASTPGRSLAWVALVMAVAGRARRRRAPRRL